MINDEPIHFHWRLVQNGESDGHLSTWQDNDKRSAWPDINQQGDFCKIAEELEIESVLLDINYAKPDPVLLTMALIKSVSKLGFITAVRPGLLSPTLFAQQINTISTFSNGRIYLNVVAGHSPDEQKTYGDFLSHNERYERTDEFLNICTQFWHNNGPVNCNGKFIKVEEALLKTPYVSDNSSRPFIFIGGGSQPAIDLTLKYGDCLMQLGDEPEKIRQKVKPVISAGRAAGLRFSVICRPTNEEAVVTANQLLESMAHLSGKQDKLVAECDSQSVKGNYKLADNEWPSPNLWTGAVKFVGPYAVVLVGSYEEVAAKIIEYKQAGITHFILSGWPKLEEMKRFATHVIPLIRKIENSSNVSSPVKESLNISS
jgi:alkanesulfonate monooxygenase